MLNDAATIVIYSDGGAKHPMIQRSICQSMEHLPLMHKGVGLVCIHYAVEVPKAESRRRRMALLLDWTGGYFEPYWSVNPHWTADYKQFPDHPISAASSRSRSTTNGTTTCVFARAWTA